MSLQFEVRARDSAARVGRLRLGHAVVDTPVFMPVGTYGTVKAMTPEELERIGTQLIVANTFHLMLRPGAEQLAALGGLHQFMGCRTVFLPIQVDFKYSALATCAVSAKAALLSSRQLTGRRSFLTRSVRWRCSARWARTL